MIKSFAQARQYRWLVQMEPTLDHGLVLNSLHSHDLELEEGHYLPLHSILWIFLWGLH
jgi:hypothetical protein